MQVITALLYLLAAASCTGRNEGITFVGSTPAGSEVRAFLDIPLPDSIDFVRWKIRLGDGQYHAVAHYGLSKPNTNGFVNDGTIVNVKGSYSEKSGRYAFQNGSRTLHAARWREKLLHLLDEKHEPLVGNAGFSYTLNGSVTSGMVSAPLPGHELPAFDSMRFVGRTPCNIPGMPPRAACYKLKWSVVLFSGSSPLSGRYVINGTATRDVPPRTQAWRLLRTRDGQPFYELQNGRGSASIFLLPASDNVLLFTDADGQPLVGDEDFSYTLNRRG